MKRYSWAWMVQVVSFTHFVYLCVCILETVVTTKSLRIQMDKELVIIMNMTFKNTTHSELSNHRPSKRVKGTVLTLIVPSLVMDYIAHLRRSRNTARHRYKCVNCSIQINMSCSCIPSYENQLIKHFINWKWL
jgi:hypothetical protein